MCGIAGLIHRDGSAGIGSEMTSMLQALKHRGPDSAGFALYGEPRKDDYILRFKVAEQEDLAHGFEIHNEVKKRKALVDERIQSDGTTIVEEENVTEYAFRYRVSFANGAAEDQEKLKRFADFIEDVEGAEILSMGRSLELVKDLGDAKRVSEQYRLGEFQGTHAIGHTRMATESDVDIRSAHPYWAYPFSDVAVVHNGQLTNYWGFRRVLERRGRRFVSDCDSELIAVYLADRMADGMALREAMELSVSELDGVFTYLVATADSLGMAKDTMAAKPLVLYESDSFIGMASEEVAIRSIFRDEIDTWDPYEGEVMVWRT